MTRRTPKPRRQNTTVAAQWQGHEFTVCTGFDPDTQQPCEVFADTAKGGQMQATIADACVLISIAIQHGITPDAMGKSLSRVPDLMTGGDADMPGSPIGTIIAILKGETNEPVDQDV